MDKTCQIVRDLLPLYVDQVCSAGSAEMIEEHIAVCADCREMKEKLSQPLPQLDIDNEKKAALRHQMGRRRSFTAAIIICAVLFVPVLTCFIVNLAVSGRLDWFFIVLSSIAVFASLVVIPLLTPKHRFFRTVIGFVASLMFLFGVCCNFSDGRWFFVATASTVFGLFFVLAPALANAEPLRSLLKNQKSLFVMAGDTLLYAVMMASIAFFTESVDFAKVAFDISAPLIVFAWLLFLSVRYVKGGFRKAAFACLVSGVFVFLAESVIGALLGAGMSFPRPCFLYGDFSAVSDNIKWAFLLAGVVLFIIFGWIGRKKR